MAQVLAVVNNDQDKLVLVDDDDLALCQTEKWYLCSSTGYMITGRKPCRPLHVFVMGRAPDGLVIHHKNRNKLDNQKSNLEFVTNAVNIMNSDTKRGKYKGIYETPCHKWTVRFTRNYKIVIIGNYNTIEEAVIARDLFLKEEGLTSVLS